MGLFLYLWLYLIIIIRPTIILLSNKFVAKDITCQNHNKIYIPTRDGKFNNYGSYVFVPVIEALLNLPHLHIIVEREVGFTGFHLRYIAKESSHTRVCIANKLRICLFSRPCGNTIKHYMYLTNDRCIFHYFFQKQRVMNVQ